MFFSYFVHIELLIINIHFQHQHCWLQGVSLALHHHGCHWQVSGFSLKFLRLRSYFFKQKCLSRLNRRLQRGSFGSLFLPVIVSWRSDWVSPQRLNPAVTMADSRGANEPVATAPEPTDGEQQVGTSVTQDHSPKAADPQQTTEFPTFSLSFFLS